jgi:hypothetical protein
VALHSHTVKDVSNPGCIVELETEPSSCDLYHLAQFFNLDPCQPNSLLMSNLENWAR